MSRRPTPPDWPEHCTAYDPDAPDTLRRADWTYHEGDNEGAKAIIFEHRPTGLRFVVCTQPDYGCSWKLAALCQNPPRSRKTMRTRAQEAMRLGLALAGTTAQRAEAECEAWVAGTTQRLH